MADNVCGPSNALNNLQKHSTINRSLQIDRIVSRNPPLQDFRSTRDSNKADIEAEFQAFQDGNLLVSEEAFPAQALTPSASCFTQTHPIPWALDFQQLSLTETPPQIYSYVPPSTSHTQELYKDSEQHHLTSQRFPPTIRNNAIGLIGVNSLNIGEPLSSIQTENWILEDEQPIQQEFDAEAFARAFDEASKSEDVNVDRKQMDPDQNILDSNSFETLIGVAPLEDHVYLSQARIGADLVNEERTAIENDADSLSKVATRLLNNLHHEQSPKFQNSRFLELMRQFRDREATIEKDQIVSIKKA